MSMYSKVKEHLAGIVNMIIVYDILMNLMVDDVRHWLKHKSHVRGIKQPKTI